MGTIFRREWFWRMEELTKRNGKGVWMRKIDKVLKRFDASVEWLNRPVAIRDEEMEDMRRNDETQGREKMVILNATRMKSIAEVLEEVEVLIDTRLFDEFSKRKSSMCLKETWKSRM